MMTKMFGFLPGVAFLVPGGTDALGAGAALGWPIVTPIVGGSWVVDCAVVALWHAKAPVAVTAAMAAPALNVPAFGMRAPRATGVPARRSRTPRSSRASLRGSHRRHGGLGRRDMLL